MLRLATILCSLCFLSIGLFTRGFLLSRETLLGYNQSSPSVPRLVDRVVIILVDALRPDFIFPNIRSHPPGASVRPHSLSYISDALRSKSNVAGFAFVADPPTTTAQRLKSLTSGTFPTFIEAGQNFDSAVLREDNIIAQLKQQNISRAVLGDDTWLNLFPEPMWNRTHVYPSLDVYDLHTVDRGILSHLYPLLQNDQHEFVVAHFLGVDHVGHRYDARHPEMSSKLAEINECIEKTSAVLQQGEQDSLLLVFGDHGITDSGDHGGGSEDEVTSFLFAEYFFNTKTTETEVHNSMKGKDNSDSSRNKTVTRANNNSPLHESTAPKLETFLRQMQQQRHTYYDPENRTWDYEGRALKGTEVCINGTIPYVYQVDLVPTLAMLFGIPIPQNNMGRIIPEILAFPIFAQYTDGVEVLENAYLDNIHQVSECLRNSHHADEKLEYLSQKLSNNSALHAEKYVKQSKDTESLSFLFACDSALREASSRLRLEWTHYDENLMIISLSGLAICWAASFLCLLQVLLPDHDLRDIRNVKSVRLKGFAHTIILVSLLVFKCFSALSSSLIIEESAVVWAGMQLTLVVLAAHCSVQRSKALTVTFVALYLLHYGVPVRTHSLALASSVVKHVEYFSPLFLACSGYLTYSFLHDKHTKFLNIVCVCMLGCYRYFRSEPGCQVAILSSRTALLLIVILFSLSLRNLRKGSQAAYVIVSSCIYFGILVSQPKYIFSYALYIVFLKSVREWSKDFSEVKLRKDDKNLFLLATPILAVYVSHYGLFFATGHHTVLSTLDWTSAYTAMGEYNWYTGMFFVSSESFLAYFVGPIAATVLVSGVFESSYSKKIVSPFRIVSQVLLFNSLGSIFGAALTIWLHRRHLMLWEIFTPYYIYTVIGNIMSIVVTLFFFAITR